LVYSPEADAAEKRNLHGTGRHQRVDNERVFAFLNGLSIAHERKCGFDFALVERRRPEEVEIDGNAMAEIKRDGSAAVKHEG